MARKAVMVVNLNKATKEAIEKEMASIVDSGDSNYPLALPLKQATTTVTIHESLAHISLLQNFENTTE